MARAAQLALAGRRVWVLKTLAFLPFTNAAKLTCWPLFSPTWRLVGALPTAASCVLLRCVEDRAGIHRATLARVPRGTWDRSNSSSTMSHRAVTSAQQAGVILLPGVKTPAQLSRDRDARVGGLGVSAPSTSTTLHWLFTLCTYASPTYMHLLAPLPCLLCVDLGGCVYAKLFLFPSDSHTHLACLLPHLPYFS